MPDQTKERPPLVMGNPVPPAEPVGVTVTDIVAAMLALVWLIGVVVYFTATGGDSLLVKLLVAFVPVALIGFFAMTARTIRALRDEARRLKIAVDAMRHSYVQQQQAAAAATRPHRAEAMRHTDGAPATFTTSRRDAGALRPAAGPTGTEQPALALETPAEDLRPPMTVDEFIRALNFPDNSDDTEGFRCLRLALEDREAARLVRAAQDVLTLLAQDGIYMDDLHPDRARPEVWRRFAQGERGRAVAALGGIRDRSSIALTGGRMRSDAVFRDAAHHFLRQFDRSFQAFEKTAADEDLIELSDTRTARAFMLFGRVAGVFD